MSQDITHERALIVFAKPPEPGEVKTRLTSELTEEQAARLYRAFLRDSLESYGTLQADIRLYVTPPKGDFPTALLPEFVGLFEQRGNGLGERMATAFDETFAAGYKQCVIIGTDHPTLPLRYIREAFQVDGDEVRVGPSEDGGYYLLGLARPAPVLFDEMEYSHPDVMAQTVSRAEEAGRPVYRLPEWYDVDNPPALKRLGEDIQQSQKIAPHTREVLRELQEEEAIELGV